jgi:pyridoxamine 5'-phosphate oxidase
LNEAYIQEIADPNAMIVATVSPTGEPALRAVLMKHWSREEGFIFCSNSKSRKGEHMAHNNHVSILFYWKSLYRQVNMEGVVSLADRKTSEHYFALRPRESQLVTYVSQQSEALSSQKAFDVAIEQARVQLGTGPIPCPASWSGYVFVPQRIEFWRGQPYRRHERILFTRTAGNDSWSQSFLYP